MKKVKIKIALKSGSGSQTADFESNVVHAKTPATPLQTLIEAAAHLGRLAEAYEGAGDVLVLAVGDAVQGVKDRVALTAQGA